MAVFPLKVCSQLLRRRQWHPTPVLLSGKSHGRRSLVGCSPWDRKESDMTERLHFHVSLSCIGEGNGNPLQCSCLENPRDGGACWAAESQTRLKRLGGGSSQLLCVCVLSHVQLFATPWTEPRQTPLFMGFPRQEYWSGLPFPSTGDLPEPGIEPKFPSLAGGFFNTVTPGKPIQLLKVK